MTVLYLKETPISNTTLRFPKFELYPFQDEDVRKLLFVRNRLIANDMGTGKTFEAIALDLLQRHQKTNTKSLVIAPLSTLKSTWEEHIRDLTDLKVRTINPKYRKIFLRDAEPDVFILHWDAIRWKRVKIGLTKDGKDKFKLIPPNQLELLYKIQWDHIIADEAHRAKNRNALQTKSLKKLKTRYKTALTGTPIANKPDDIWSILNWLYPQVFSSYWSFFHTFIDADRKHAPNGIGYWKIKGVKNEDKLEKNIKLFYIRRKKEEVLKDLPAKYYTDVRVDLTPKQKQAYIEMKEDMLAWLEVQDDEKPLVAPIVLAQLTRLRQLACAYHDTEKCTEPSSKLDALMDIILDNSTKEFSGRVVPEKSLVIFSNFRQVIRLLETRLKKVKIDYVRITGDDHQLFREESIKKFQQGYPKIFLGTIRAGSEGITLTRSSTVIFIDRDRTPAGNAQAEDRVHRIGQDKGVQIISILANGTTDFKDLKDLQYKKDWIKQLLKEE